jgi:hypothetical protein
MRVLLVYDELLDKDKDKDEDIDGRMRLNQGLCLGSCLWSACFRDLGKGKGKDWEVTSVLHSLSRIPIPILLLLRQR